MDSESVRTEKDNKKVEYVGANMHFRLPGDTVRKIKECIDLKMRVHRKKCSMTDVVRWGIDKVHKELSDLDKPKQ